MHRVSPLLTFHLLTGWSGAAAAKAGAGCDRTSADVRITDTLRNIGTFPIRRAEPNPKSAPGQHHRPYRCGRAVVNSALGRTTWTPLLRSTSSVSSTSPATLINI